LVNLGELTTYDTAKAYFVTFLDFGNRGKLSETQILPLTRGNEGQKVAIVTGANKGIGFAIVRALCKQFDGDVYLTARNEERGLAAVKELEKEGLKPKFHQLDITDKNSVEKLRDDMVSEYRGIDVLVNNAGMALFGDNTPFGQQVKDTFKVNYYSARQVCDLLLPHVKPGGRVVNVSSLATRTTLKKISPKVRDEFWSDTITMERLDALMDDFVKHADVGDHLACGYSNSAYRMSKLGFTVMSKILARKLKEQGRDVLLNICCPGWVRTDLGGEVGSGKKSKATKSPDQGADTPAYLALIPKGALEPHGKFLEDRKIITQWW